MCVSVFSESRSVILRVKGIEEREESKQSVYHSAQQIISNPGVSNLPPSFQDFCSYHLSSLIPCFALTASFLFLLQLSTNPLPARETGWLGAYLLLLKKKKKKDFFTTVFKESLSQCDVYNRSGIFFLPSDYTECGFIFKLSVRRCFRGKRKILHKL